MYWFQLPINLMSYSQYHRAWALETATKSHRMRYDFVLDCDMIAEINDCVLPVLLMNKNCNRKLPTNRYHSFFCVCRSTGIMARTIYFFAVCWDCRNGTANWQYLPSPPASLPPSLPPAMMLCCCSLLPYCSACSTPRTCLLTQCSHDTPAKKSQHPFQNVPAESYIARHLQVRAITSRRRV